MHHMMAGSPVAAAAAASEHQLISCPACKLANSTSSVPHEDCSGGLPYLPHGSIMMGVCDALQGLARIPETLVIAVEFIVMQTPNTQQAALGELQRAIFQLHPDLKVRDCHVVNGKLTISRRGSVHTVEAHVAGLMQSDPEPVLL